MVTNLRTDEATWSEFRVPLEPAEIRELAACAQRGIRAYEQAETEGWQRATGHVQEYAVLCAEALSAAAGLVGLNLDASMLPELLSWTDWDPFFGERYVTLEQDYFDGLARLLAQCPVSMQMQALSHPSPDVREALAKALHPEAPEVQALWEQLLLDSQYVVAHQARRRYGSRSNGASTHVTDAGRRWATWHASVFSTSPEVALPSETCDKLRRALETEPGKVSEREQQVIELLPELPAEFAVQLCQYMLQQAWSADRKPFAEHVVRHEEGHRAFAQGVWVAVQNSPSARYQLGSVKDVVKEPLGDRAETVCLCWLDSLCQVQDPELAAELVDGVGDLLAGLWPANAAPAPLLRCVLHLQRLDVASGHYHGLSRALRDSERLAECDGALVETVLERGLSDFELRRLLEQRWQAWSPDERSAFEKRAADTSHDALSTFLLERRAEQMARERTPQQCRAQMVAWLDDARTGRLIRKSWTLLTMALPELRHELTPQLDAETATSRIGTIVDVYGGGRRTGGRPTPPKEVQQKLGAWFDPDGGPPTDAEWSAYLALQAQPETPLLTVLGYLSDGPWRPEEITLLSRLTKAFDTATADRSLLVLRVLQIVGSKPDAVCLPLLQRARACCSPRVDADFTLRGLDELIAELGGTANATGESSKPTPSNCPDDDWGEEDGAGST